MNRADLRKLIREEIENVLNESGFVGEGDYTNYYECGKCDQEEWDVQSNTPWEKDHCPECDRACLPYKCENEDGQEINEDGTVKKTKKSSRRR